jgi:hypothetical protein
MSKTPEYKLWNNMKSRCLNPNATRYECYGGRGIQVCDRWMESFENFFLDMGNRPSSRHSLDRIDCNGDYEPSNCRWATFEEQNRNYRRNVMVDSVNGPVCLKDAAVSAGLKPNVVIQRRLAGWQESDWFIPVGAKRRKPLLGYQKTSRNDFTTKA